MFGYVTTNMEEMKIKDYRIYHGFYCGVCQDLKEGHGQTSRFEMNAYPDGVENFLSRNFADRPV